MKKRTYSEAGITLTEQLVTIGIIGILGGLLLSVIAYAKKKAYRVSCVNNLSQIGKAFIGFANDNDGRLPWQLTTADPPWLSWKMTPSQRVNHFGDYYEEELGAIFSISTLKNELQTAKILHSPCDPERQANNEEAQANWGSYNTSNGTKISRNAISYLLVRGADTGRPETVLATTRNLSTCDLAKARWSGADETPVSSRAMALLNRSQGQMVLADGSAHQSSDADLGTTGKRVSHHINSAGGVSIGKADTHIIGCGAIVDLMMVYNPKLCKLYGDAAGIQRKARISVCEVNTGLSRSAACAQLRLVAVEPIQYSTAGNIGADLSKIRGDKQVNQLRAKYKADLVCLVSEAGGGGVAYTGGGKVHGYSVIARHTIMKSGWTLGHELGHNFGCPHRTGHAFYDGQAGHHTFMSMGHVQRIQRMRHPHMKYRGLRQYSNPDVNYSGTLTGTVTNNNAAIIKRNAKRIARFY